MCNISIFFSVSEDKCVREISGNFTLANTVYLHFQSKPLMNL